MRFSAPRSVSPSPVRRSKPRKKSSPPVHKRRHSSTFGLNSSSESDSNSEYDSDLGDSIPSSLDDSDSDSDSFCYGSESEIPVSTPKPTRLSSRSTREQNYIEDTIAAVRLRTRHHDPYEEWEKEMRKDSLKTARKEHQESQAKFQQLQKQQQREESRRLAEKYKHDAMEISRVLEALRMKQQQDEQVLRERLRMRDQKLWERVEMGIKIDQDKEQARVDQERRVREEEEKKKKAEEERKRVEELERKEAEEKKRREEEEARVKKEEEDRKEREEREVKEREVRERSEKMKAEEKARKEMNLSTPEQDWIAARKNLNITKTQGTRFVKANKEMKPILGAGRRSIRAKIGQLTNDPESINNISTQLISILRPPTSPPHPSPIYTSLLSALSKAIILQAETETTAEKRSAIPLARTTFNCLETLEGFPEVLFAKMVQRVGSWLIPCVLPTRDFDGRLWGGAPMGGTAPAPGGNATGGNAAREMKMMMGYREGGLEAESQYSMRVMGVMRVYFEVLKIRPGRGPLKGMWQLPRFWIWIARLVGEKELLATSTGAEVLHVALEVLGAEAKDIWGQQFVKVLGLVYQGTIDGLGNGKLIGGTTPEGLAARARVKLEVENIMKGGR